MKYCKKCDSEKDLSDFTMNRAAADGLNYYCRSCTQQPMLYPKATHNYKDYLRRAGLLKHYQRYLRNR